MKKIAMMYVLFVAYATSLFSCNQKQNDPADINGMASKFSDLECRAFTLREQRYSLADKIRFTEDSISKKPAGSTEKQYLQTKLDSYLKDKADILSVSLRLADTIKLQLDTIIKIRLQSRDKIDRFDKALSMELEKKHCK